MAWRLAFSSPCLTSAAEYCGKEQREVLIMHPSVILSNNQAVNCTCTLFINPILLTASFASRAGISALSVASFSRFVWGLGSA
jgi:hypothetical protein